MRGAQEDGEFLDDGQAQTKTWIVARESGLKLPEAFENRAQLIGRDADSGVANLNRYRDAGLRFGRAAKR